MAVVVLDAKGLKCPQPVLKVAAKTVDMSAGDVLEVLGDCPTFENDIKAWCDRMKRPLLWVKEEKGGGKRIQIQF
ncbi:MAG: sulfurtransferase TusA family protein [Elusimicrobiota bacterium]